MNEFTYHRAADPGDAVRSLVVLPSAKYLGGGTNLVDLMRQDVERPAALVDVSRLSKAIEDRPDGGLRIGAAATNTAVAEHRGVRERFPLISRAIVSGATGQIRNMATAGGNLLQRTRCTYFYDLAARCNKREPGTGCDAAEGFNRIHAILGASAACVATHPSDLCVALAALDAIVNVRGPAGERQIKFADFHKLPGETPNVETSLAAGELITSIDVPALPFARRSTYMKARDRASYAFALVSVAAIVDLDGGSVRAGRLALGGVAHKPWRATAAEAILADAPATDETFRRAADAELRAAVGLSHNAFKIELARRMIVDALASLTQEGRP